MIFQNRAQAGKKLAVKLLSELTIKDKKNLLVLAIPRGGMVVGRELAKSLNCSLDVVVTKKIGAPGNPELAIGAVGAIGEPVINEELAGKIGASSEYIRQQTLNIQGKVEERERLLRKNNPPLKLKNKTVIITDDGVATGATMEAAVEIVRQQNPERIIVAVPVVARDSLAKIAAKADEVIYLDAPLMFFAVGQFYKEFEQLSDKEAVEILNLL